MKELLSTIKQWNDEKRPFAIARVIQTWGSSPRPVGSALIVSSRAEMAGSVSGGCVEGAVVKEAASVIASQSGKRLSYGVSDEEAWVVGLTCGGKIQIYLQPFPTYPSDEFEVWSQLEQSVSKNKSCVFTTMLMEGESMSALFDSKGTMTGASMPSAVVEKAIQALDRRNHELITVGEVTYFIQVFPRRSQLLIIGAAHITAELVILARRFDFETIVIDPRGAFANRTQFEEAPDRIIEKYPSEVLNEFALDGNTYAVTLSHDPKIDDDALLILLRSKVAYVGALGSRKTHEKRLGRLRQAGFSEEEIGRIESPVGMDLHAQGAKEIALSILSSVIKVRNRFV